MTAGNLFAVDDLGRTWAMIKKQFTLYLENKPGALAGLTRRLATAKVNIEGISVAASGDVGLVQVVVSNAKATKKALSGGGIAFTVQDVALVPLPNRPGALSRVIQKLAKLGVNVNYVYATVCDCSHGCNCFAIISAPDLKKVEEAWASA